MRVFVVFGTIFLYGMERAVIETFDCLRPEVEAVFHTSSYNRNARTPLMQELESRNLTSTFFPDERGWPAMRRPRSLRESWATGRMLLSSNWSVLKGSWNCDVIYLPSNYWARHAILAAIAARMRGKKVVYHFHNLFTEHYGFFDWFRYLVTHFIHNTQLGYEWTSEANPKLLTSKHVILPCVVDPRENIEADPLAQRELAGKRNLVFIGQAAPHKGIDLLLLAFQQIASQHSDAVLHIIGSIQPGYENEFRQLLVGPFADRIRLWGYRSDALHLLSKAYVYVHPTPPSRCHESFGRGLVEAMSLGVPPVCFASGALSEIVQDGLSGLVCAKESADSLARALDTLLSEPALRDKLARGALARYKQKYAPAIVAPLWREFMRQLEAGDTGQAYAPPEITCTNDRSI
jgi:glycosyltransferase involved in cell wall biosynthesis